MTRFLVCVEAVVEGSREEADLVLSQLEDTASRHAELNAGFISDGEFIETALEPEHSVKA